MAATNQPSEAQQRSFPTLRKLRDDNPGTQLAAELASILGLADYGALSASGHRATAEKCAELVENEDCDQTEYTCGTITRCAKAIRAFAATMSEAPQSEKQDGDWNKALEEVLRELSLRTNKYMSSIEDYYCHGLWQARDIVLALKRPTGNDNDTGGAR
jgi:hypothetical protein